MWFLCRRISGTGKLFERHLAALVSDENVLRHEESVLRKNDESLPDNDGISISCINDSDITKDKWMNTNHYQVKQQEKPES